MSVPESLEFQNLFETFWEVWKKEFNNFTSKREWWELFKLKVKQIAMESSKQMAKETQIKISSLTKNLDQEKHKTNPDNEKIQIIESKLQEIWDEKAEGAKIRARVKWLEEGEKSTKYFFNLEKKNTRNKLWSKVKTSDGKIKIGINNILNEQIKFYSNLLATEGFDNEAATELIEQIDTKIPEEMVELCEKDITKEELEKVIKTLKTNKSPGDDGIIAEFYIKYWPKVQNEFLEVVKEIETLQTLCDSQYRGVISLLYKKGEREDIKKLASHNTVEH